ncbi:hypothetical protein E2542_SST29339 [Spatholobus suberectus]|nr:hypothetical protein E2542_SST29339 [Spatholobus suberectus]
MNVEILQDMGGGVMGEEEESHLWLENVKEEEMLLGTRMLKKETFSQSWGEGDIGITPTGDDANACKGRRAGSLQTYQSVERRRIARGGDAPIIVDLKLYSWC